MRIIPILIDSRPAYLGCRASDSTLLQLPVGGRTLAAEIMQGVSKVTAHAPVVLPTVDVDGNYLRRLTSGCPEIGQVIEASRFADPLAYHDASDSLLIISPACYPADGLDLESLVNARLNDARMARHLLASSKPARCAPRSSCTRAPMAACVVSSAISSRLPGRSRPV